MKTNKVTSVAWSSVSSLTSGLGVGTARLHQRFHRPSVQTGAKPSVHENSQHTRVTIDRNDDLQQKHKPFNQGHPNASKFGVIMLFVVLLLLLGVRYGTA
jgi:hypothetical protein